MPGSEELLNETKKSDDPLIFSNGSQCWMNIRLKKWTFEKESCYQTIDFINYHLSWSFLRWPNWKLSCSRSPRSQTYLHLRNWLMRRENIISSRIIFLQVVRHLVNLAPAMDRTMEGCEPSLRSKYHNLVNQVTLHLNSNLIKEICC